MRWLRDPAAREFRIDTQLVGDKTMLFSRWEKSSMELLDKRVNKYGRPIQTYVFAFEKATTRPAKGCEGSTGYHRIVAYVRIHLYSSLKAYTDIYVRNRTLEA